MTDEEFYKDEWRRMDEAKADASKGLDNTIMIIGTGLFALSINFLFGLHSYIQLKELVVLSWFSLFVSIVSHLWGYRVAAEHADFAQVKLRDWSTKPPPKGHYLIGADRVKFDSTLQLTQKLNSIALGALIIGIAGLLVFASINILAIPPSVDASSNTPDLKG